MNIAGLVVSPLVTAFNWG